MQISLIASFIAEQAELGHTVTIKTELSQRRVVLQVEYGSAAGDPCSHCCLPLSELSEEYGDESIVFALKGLVSAIENRDQFRNRPAFRGMREGMG